jgi:hypothetical protein
MIEHHLQYDKTIIKKIIPWKIILYKYSFGFLRKRLTGIWYLMSKSDVI